MPSPTSSIAINPMGGSVVKNGYIVTAVTKTGKFEDRSPPTIEHVPSVGAYSALLDNRLIASGATVIVTQ